MLHGVGANLECFALQSYPEHEVFRFGRIMKEKGIGELLTACRRLYQEFPGKVILDLVGFFEDAYKEPVEQMALDGMVVFYGFQSDPRPDYAAADCVVLPSYREGMSNVLLEAAATARPLITTDISGCREAVDDKITGYPVEPKSAESLYQAMQDILRLDYVEKKRWGLPDGKKWLWNLKRSKLFVLHCFR